MRRKSGCLTFIEVYLLYPLKYIDAVVIAIYVTGFIALFFKQHFANALPAVWLQYIVHGYAFLFNFIFMLPVSNSIYTIGHSTHNIEVFIAMLQSYGVEVLADIRSFPGSRKFPQYNKAALAASLHEAGIQYLHFPDLGGKRPAPAGMQAKQPFGGYHAYMQTDLFKVAIGQLETVAVGKKTVYMCSEVLWWQCHRSMVSDYLKANGWNVLHIMGAGKVQAHFRPGDEKQLQGRLFE